MKASASKKSSVFSIKAFFSREGKLSRIQFLKYSISSILPSAFFWSSFYFFKDFKFSFIFSYLGLITFILGLISYFSSIQKRLRDINLLGYWTLKAVFIPGFGQLFLLGLYFIPSSNGKRNMRLPIWNWKEGKIEYTAPDKTEQENSS